jgi:hypothetical protein
MTARVEPSWNGVEELLTRLAQTRTEFATANSTASWISRYERGRRLLLENDNGSRWVQIGDIQECWETFQRLGRIHRRDVLDPGRCSAFMMALFAQLDGVVVERADSAEFLALRAVDSPEGEFVQHESPR